MLKYQTVIRCNFFLLHINRITLERLLVLSKGMFMSSTVNQISIQGFGEYQENIWKCQTLIQHKVDNQYIFSFVIFMIYLFLLQSHTHLYIYVYMEREREREKFCSLMHSLCASKDCAVLSSHFLLKMSRIQLLQLWSLTLSVLVGRKMWFMDITTSYFKSAPTLF